MNFLEQADCIRHEIAKLSNMVQPACKFPQIPDHRGFFENNKGPGTSFQATFFADFFDEKCSFVILHKLSQFNYQSVFTSMLFGKMSVSSHRKVGKILNLSAGLRLIISFCN